MSDVALEIARGAWMVALQLAHMLLVLALAPGLTGFVRWVKAHLLGRRGEIGRAPV